jgi:PAS domain S-box-containing protein
MIKKKAIDLQSIILDNVPYLIWFKDNEGKYLYVNQAFAQSYRLETEDIIGKSDFDFCSKEKALEYQHSDDQVRQSRKMHFVEQMENLFGGTANFETFKSPALNKNGDVIGIVGISRELSDNSQMEKTLHEREEQFRALLQNSSDAISIINRQGKIIFEGSEKNKISDFEIGELLHKPFFDIVHPDDIGQIKSVI